MDTSDWILGHEPFGCRINVKKELRRLQRDPLEPLLQALGIENPSILSDDYSRYRHAYWFYYLSIDRYLREMSLAARWSKGPYWAWRARKKQTTNQRKLSIQYNRVADFLEFDLFNSVVHARILLDRTVALSRLFLPKGNAPSFTSFNEHKKFFKRLSIGSYGEHEEYAQHIRTKTDWFEMPLKEVRDKYLVHASPKHMKIMGYWNNGYELDLSIMVPAGDNPEKPMEKVKVIRVNVLRMSYDIDTFLRWFGEYGVVRLSTKKGKRDS
jgi:hypothetical protein